MTEKPDFEAFWSEYPRRVAKGHARKAWDRATNNTPAATILIAVRAHKAAGMFSDDLKFIPHPATWLNRESYDDDVTPRSTPQFRSGPAQLLAEELMDIGPLIEDVPQYVLEGPGHAD